jgi:hypothetical protein
MEKLRWILSQPNSLRKCTGGFPLCFWLLGLALARSHADGAGCVGIQDYRDRRSQGRVTEGKVVTALPTLLHTFMPIIAEVSDKAPTLRDVWVGTVVISIACLFASAWKRRMAFAALPVIALWALIITSEIRDDYVGPAIVSELGRGYVTQAYIAAVTPVLFLAIGFRRSGRGAASARCPGVRLSALMLLLSVIRFIDSQ